MAKYCSKCCLSFDTERCPVCKRKSVRDTEPDDLCFLTEKEQIWSGMLADVLKQKNIPFTQKSTMGAGMALRAGPLFETVRFYVFYAHLEKAKEIVDELFSSSTEENDSEETEECADLNQE